MTFVYISNQFRNRYRLKLSEYYSHLIATCKVQKAASLFSSDHRDRQGLRMLLLPTLYIFLPNVVQYLHPRSNRTCRLIVPLRFSPIGLSRPADSQSGPRGRPLSGPLHISSLYPSLPFPGYPPPSRWAWAYRLCSDISLFSSAFATSVFCVFARSSVPYFV